MRSAIARLMCLSAVVCAVLAAGAQGPPSRPADPRVGLKPGLRDAGIAAWHMQLVTSQPKPPGFFDPAMPAGEPTEPEPPPNAPPDPRPYNRLNYANSDLAFKGDHLFIGNFTGFNVYDIEDPRTLRHISSIVCPGGQGDVSVHGNLLVMSVEQTRGRVDCGTQGVEAAVSAERFRGVRIFDISKLRKPRQVAAAQTCRGSHAQTLVRLPS